MSDEKKHSPLEVLFMLATIISAIALLAKILSRGQEDEEHRNIEEKAARDRQRLYRQIPPSYSDLRYRDWADTLDKSILGGVSENEEAVYAVFQKMKNISDVQMLIEAFGHRRQQMTTQYISLPQAITIYFNKPEKETINYILKTKKIDYTFE